LDSISKADHDSVIDSCYISHDSYSHNFNLPSFLFVPCVLSAPRAEFHCFHGFFWFLGEIPFLEILVPQIIALFRPTLILMVPQINEITGFSWVNGGGKRWNSHSSTTPPSPSSKSPSQRRPPHAGTASPSMHPRSRSIAFRLRDSALFSPVFFVIRKLKAVPVLWTTD
jgi:hypothetical protein